jgi:hypothetical protein
MFGQNYVSPGAFSSNTGPQSSFNVPFTFSKPAGLTLAQVKTATLLVDSMFPSDAPTTELDISMLGASGQVAYLNNAKGQYGARATAMLDLYDAADANGYQTGKDLLTALFDDSLQGVVASTGVIYGVSLRLETSN